MNSDKFRTEHDSLGGIDVPAEALYGAQTQRAIENFPISGIKMPRSFIRAAGLIKYACALANRNLQAMDADISEAIANAALAVAEGRYDVHFAVDVFQTGSGTSTNMNANEVIARLASQSLGRSVHPNDHVNMGQSSNDVIPTSINLSASFELVEKLLPALQQLRDDINQKSQQFRSIVKTGRTHLMDAMPLTIGQEMSAWSQQIHQNMTRLTDCLPRLQQLAIGATAVGTGINTHKDFGSQVVSVLNTLHDSYCFTVKDNYFEALSCQDTAVELSGHLKTTAVSLMKISNDLRWMNSGPLAGLGEITLPKLQPGSSIMPGKVNPVIPEAVAQVAAQVMGNDTTITVAAQSGNFQLNVMLPLIAHNLLESITLLASSARLLADKVIVGMEVNTKTLEATLARNPVLVTALNRYIGYDKSAEIAQRAYLEERSVLDVAIEMTDLDENTLRALLDPQNLCRHNS